ncbi:lipoate--protein ligase [Clostridium estertheticum]|uniref:lipoate--protein ligase n=1 Tax=Clostridium estertheticum TaxID=238834 RepID=UPI0013E95BBC|nr:lipoate--protein ligase [Clostridium estertheticum]MBZ9688818.1 lipoate--protein ligase [Clostridium estertheticum]
MIYINNTNTNPYFNMAVEEYILKEFKEDCFMLWRNQPCIVVGKNQNTLSEINMDYIKANNIPVVRRLSGGGTVFHDLGNLNFTFIKNDSEGNFNNFRKFTMPILNVLTSLNINAEFSGRNDLTIEGKKFSGNAQYNYKNRVLHHGTLLFSSNITDLSKALQANPLKFQDKSIKSVLSRVTNISSHLKEPLSILEFEALIKSYIITENSSDSLYEFTEYDLENINKLASEKYSTWEWNFGHSPKYNFINEKKFSFGTIECNMQVQHGIIKDISIYGDFFSKLDVSDIEAKLIGVNHVESEVKSALSGFNISDYFSNAIVEDILSCMF